MDIARLDCNFQENQMVPLLQREALLKYCPEQYRNSNTKYQESVRLILEYWQCNITIALQVLGYLYCNIGIACWINWNFITGKNFNKNWIKFEDCPPQHWFLSLHWMQSAFWNINWIRSTLKQWESNDYKQYQDEIYGLLYIISYYFFSHEMHVVQQFNMVIGWKTYTEKPILLLESPCLFIR